MVVRLDSTFTFYLQAERGEELKRVIFGGAENR